VSGDRPKTTIGDLGTVRVLGGGLMKALRTCLEVTWLGLSLDLCTDVSKKSRTTNYGVVVITDCNVRIAPCNPIAWERRKGR
jgi:hypothetical protein